MPSPPLPVSASKSITKPRLLSSLKPCRDLAGDRRLILFISDVPLRSPPSSSLQVDPSPLIHAIIQDVLHRHPRPPSFRPVFHNSLAQLVLDLCIRLRIGDPLASLPFALPRGVWQNMTLLTQSLRMLRQAGFQCLNPTASSPPMMVG